MSEYSGKFLVRLSPVLHARLSRLAKRSGTSLNQTVGVLLALAVPEAEAELRQEVMPPSTLVDQDQETPAI